METINMFRHNRLSRAIPTVVLLALSVTLGCRSRETCAPTDNSRVRQTVRMATANLPEEIPTPIPAPVVPKNVLVISGGGMYGAYTAGFLSGWSKTGNRPQFNVVTGISTGALIATVAFLGPQFDEATREFYTSIRAADIYNTRAWILIPWAGSIASSDPLRRLIDSIVDERLLAYVATEHRRGRRLYVGTTNLTTRKLVVWDMGAVAEKGGPNATERFRHILLASCSVPGMLPPVAITSEVNGKTAIDLHVDGGVTAQLFIPPGSLPPQSEGRSVGANVYLIISGKLFTDPAPVRPRVLPVLAASAAGILHAHCRAEIASLFHQSRNAGSNFHLTAIPDSDDGRTLGLNFEPAEMRRLYDVGYFHGVSGIWMSAPPFEGAATDPPRQ